MLSCALYVEADIREDAVEAAISLLNKDANLNKLVEDVQAIQYKVIESYDVVPDEDVVNDPPFTSSPIPIPTFSFG